MTRRMYKWAALLGSSVLLGVLLPSGCERIILEQIALPILLAQ